MKERHVPRSTRTPLTERDRARLTERASLEVGPRPVGFRFSAVRHGLTAAQVRQANQRLRYLAQARPIQARGARWQAKMALRCAGILSSVKGNRLGNRRWGKRMMGKRAGKVMALHGLQHLRAIAPIGRLAAMVEREKRAAEAYFDEHGEVLPIGKEPAATPEQQRIRHLEEAWEAQQWQQQTDRLRW